MISRCRRRSTRRRACRRAAVIRYVRAQVHDAGGGGAGIEMSRRPPRPPVPKRSGCSYTSMRENVFQVYSGGLGGRVLFGVTATARRGRRCAKPNVATPSTTSASPRAQRRPKTIAASRPNTAAIAMAPEPPNVGITSAISAPYPRTNQVTGVQAVDLCCTAREQQRQCQSRAEERQRVRRSRAA